MYDGHELAPYFTHAETIVRAADKIVQNAYDEMQRIKAKLVAPEDEDDDEDADYAPVLNESMGLVIQTYAALLEHIRLFAPAKSTPNNSNDSEDDDNADGQ